MAWKPAEDYDKQSFKISKLGDGTEGSPWQTWSFMMEMALSSADAWKYVNPDPTSKDYESKPEAGSDELANFEAASRWAFQKIALCVGESGINRVLLVERGDARAAWKALRDWSVAENNIVTANLMQGLSTLKANSTSEMGDFIAQHTQLIADASSSGFNLYKPEDAGMNNAYNVQIARGLPDSWATWRTAVSGCDGLDFTPLSFLNRMKHELEMRAVNGEAGGTSTLKPAESVNAARKSRTTLL